MKQQLSNLVGKINEKIDRLKNLRILVIGDIILDRWLKGVVDRISPEAPVPVLRVEKEWNDLGGAANVAKILSYYSNNVSLLGFIGKDQFSTRIKNLLKRYGIKDLSFSYDKTIVKTRLIAHNNQQIARVDREKENLIIPEKILEENLAKIKDRFDSIFIIDYNKGLLTKNSLNLILNYLKSKNIFLSIKPSNFKAFSSFLKNQKIDLLSLNKKEFEQISKEINLSKELQENMVDFIKTYNVINLVVTLGKDGLCIMSNDNFIKVDGIEVEVFDVTGAGDNVISVFGLFYSTGLSILECGILSNIAGSICVSKPGTIAVKPSDLINYFSKMQKTNGKVVNYSITKIKKGEKQNEMVWK